MNLQDNKKKVSFLIVLLALTLCLSLTALVHAQTATNEITTVTPFAVSFLSGQAFNVQTANLNLITFTVSSGTLNATGTVTSTEDTWSNPQGTLVLNPTSSGVLTVTTTQPNLRFTTNNAPYNIANPLSFNVGTYTVTWATGASGNSGNNGNVPTATPITQPNQTNSETDIIIIACILIALLLLALIVWDTKKN